ncbi:Tol-Pal system beta propeller repeat protein TolB [Pseudorhodoferax sp.]|uniref:Tol-Pal system beta propeller repeat protein TolB n=1 Tax=Pseudorhodoferax sp. TaxID=1993553 RepID=UPI002DD665B6|nr:Tol-Pal system beta propeller repeat protein TolB [Pseudorhodoferax sp.]
MPRITRPLHSLFAAGPSGTCGHSGLSRRAFVGSLGAGGALAAWPAAAQFRVEIAGVGATQIPIVVASFRDEAASGVAVAGVVRADLARSGLFRTAESPVALDEGSTVNGAEWRARGADAVVAGSVTRLADGRFDVRYKLWDAVRGEQLLGQSKVVVAADLRLAAHRVADEIYQALVGEPGVFATRIAYVVRAGRRHTLHVTDADGEGGQVALASAEPIISPAWSPDGRELAYVSFEDQKAVVWVQSVMSGQRRRLANFRGSNSAPAWSPDGRELVVTLSTTGIAQLFVMPREGGTPRRLTTSSAIDTEAAYSPDGKQVYFVSDRGGGPQIYRVPAAGGSAERVTFAGGHNISPAISPDGRLMAYVARQSGGAFKLATLDLQNGGSPRLLTDTSDDESPSFAPNGRLIVYTSRENRRDVLMTTTLDGKIKTRLVSTGADMLESAWGPFNR